MDAHPIPKFPDASITANLNGPDGNAFSIIARAADAITKANGGDLEHAEAYIAVATASGDYERLLDVTRDWVNLKVYRD